MKRQVCVIGAGIIGLSVATHLLESYNGDIVVTVIGEAFTPDTTASDKSGGLVLVTVPDDKERNRTWIRSSMERFRKMYDSGEPGVSYSSGCFVKPDYYKDPVWFDDLVSHYQPIKTPSTSSGKTVRCSNNEWARFNTFVVNSTEYCSFLVHEIQRLGGILVRKTINTLSELGSFDVVINCAGFGAKHLACDPAVYPTKGLLVSVRAPWIKEWYDEGGTHDGRAYIFPRVNEVILGGQNQINTDDLMVHPAEVEEIIDRCVQVFPSLRNAEVLNVLVGVRPMRKGGVRLEKDETSVADSVVIHNYGHGSYGITLSWGCAVEVGELVEQSLGIKRRTCLYSKL